MNFKASHVGMVFCSETACSGAGLQVYGRGAVVPEPAPRCCACAEPCKHAAPAFSETSCDRCSSAPSRGRAVFRHCFQSTGPSRCCPCSCGTFHRGSTFRRGVGEHQDPKCIPTQVQSRTGQTEVVLTTTTEGQHSGGVSPLLPCGEPAPGGASSTTRAEERGWKQSQTARFQAKGMRF